MPIRFEQRRFPLLRIGAAQRVDPPLRVSIATDLGRFDFREHRVHVALKIAQDRVDQPLGARAAEYCRCLYCLMYHRVRGLRAGHEFSARGKQQGPQAGITKRFFEQSLDCNIDHPVAAQRAVGEVLGGGDKRSPEQAALELTQRRIEALAVNDSRDDFGRRGERFR